MSELREECYKCLYNQKCSGGVEYKSVFCTAYRQYKMPKVEDNDIKKKLQELIENQAINMSGFEYIKVEEIKKILEGKL